MADLHLGDERATAAERAVVDAVIAPYGPAVLVETERLVRGGNRRRRDRRHLLLPCLHALQHQIGWISPGGVNHVAAELQVPPAEIYGVATFYELFRTEAPLHRGPTVHVCSDSPCRISPERGELVQRLTDAGAMVHDAPCLGQCDRAPASFVQEVGRPDHVPGHRDTVELPQTDRTGMRVLARVGVVDPDSIDSYAAMGGFAALAAARAMGPDGIIAAVTAAGLSGRGGAAFPTGVKWRAVRDAPGPAKHVVANADESEPGTFKDRTLVEHDPFALIEAMAIAGLATGATNGWIYLRGEYPVAAARLGKAIDQSRAAGHLGAHFDIELRRGAGAYICGEETALFNSIEGFRGEPRNKPPFPTTQGLFGDPTAVNNPETLYNVLPIVLDGPAAYRSVGTEGSPGTRLFCVSGNVGQPGVYEVPFGTTLGRLMALAGGPTGDVAAVLLGGAAGAFVGPDRLDLALTLEDARAAGVTLGSGVVTVFNTSVDLVDVVQRIAHFFRNESCGQCVPCRIGTVRQHEVLVQLGAGGPTPQERELLDDLAAVMGDASICGLGHTASSAAQSAIRLGFLGATR